MEATDVLAFGPTQLMKIIELFSPAGTFDSTAFPLLSMYVLYVLSSTS